MLSAAGIKAEASVKNSTTNIGRKVEPLLKGRESRRAEAGGRVQDGAGVPFLVDSAIQGEVQRKEDGAAVLRSVEIASVGTLQGNGRTRGGGGGCYRITR